MKIKLLYILYCAYHNINNIEFKKNQHERVCEPLGHIKLCQEPKCL